MEYLTKDELLCVLARAKEQGSREHAMFLLSYRHGLRASEVAALTLNDVRGGRIDVRRCKGSLHTTQRLAPHTNPLLDEPSVLKAWLRERGEADGSRFLFTSRQGSGLTRRQVYNLFEAVAIRSGIEAGRRNPHILKHSLAAHLIRAGAGVAFVQRALGHADPKSTLGYCHISDDEADVVSDQTLGKVFA